MCRLLARQVRTPRTATRLDKTPFILPADGTVLGTFTVNGVDREIVFRRDDFVNITIGGLDQRTKKDKYEYLTNRTNSEKISDKKIEWAKGMIGDRGACYVNKWLPENVVYVWLVPK